MRNIIIVSVVCELLLLGGAMLAGAPVITLMRATAQRCANAILLFALALSSWVAVGLVVNGIVGSLPHGGQFTIGLVRIGDTDFNLAVFAPMMLVSLVVCYLLALSLVAAGRGRSLTECVRVATRISAR